jgi:Mn2+/Fe2+ NRAMP family transporter
MRIHKNFGEVRDFAEQLNSNELQTKYLMSARLSGTYYFIIFASTLLFIALFSGVLLGTTGLSCP